MAWRHNLALGSQRPLNEQTLFSKDEFQVEKPRGCFSNPKSRNIVLSTQMNFQNIIFAAFA